MPGCQVPCMRTLHGPCVKSPGRADRRMPEWACCRVASLSRCRTQAMPRTAAHSAPKEGLCTANSSRDGAEGRPTRMLGHAWWTAARTSVKCGTPVSATHRRRRRRRLRLRRPTHRMIIAKVRLAALRNKNPVSCLFAHVVHLKLSSGHNLLQCNPAWRDVQQVQALHARMDA